MRLFAFICVAMCGPAFGQAPVVPPAPPQAAPASGAASYAASAPAPVAQAPVPPQATALGAPGVIHPAVPNMPAYTNPQPAPQMRTPAPPAPPTPAVAGLPPDAPKVVINGGIYSEDRSVRAAIVNGNVVHEGADLGSGLVLQEIGPSGVVLAFHGSRYNIVY